MCLWARVLKVRWVPGGRAGFTFRNYILVDEWRDDLLAHELVHVRQFRQMGVIRFSYRYLRDYLSNRVAGDSHYEAYRNIGLEIEARRGVDRWRKVQQA